MEATKKCVSDRIPSPLESSEFLRKFISRKCGGLGNGMLPPPSLSTSSSPRSQSPLVGQRLAHLGFATHMNSPQPSPRSHRRSQPSTPRSNHVPMSSPSANVGAANSMLQLEIAAQQLEKYAHRSLKRPRRVIHHNTNTNSSISINTGNGRTGSAGSTGSSGHRDSHILAGSPLMFNYGDVDSSVSTGSVYSTSSEDDGMTFPCLSHQSHSMNLPVASSMGDAALPLRILTTVETRFCLPPSAMFRPRLTVESILDKRLLRYSRDFFDGAVLMAYANLRLATSGAIHNGAPSIALCATFDALIFRPRVGTTMTGKVNKIGEGHIGMLVAGIFNASIPASEGITASYAYDHNTGRWLSSTPLAGSAADSSASSITTSITTSTATTTAATTASSKQRHIAIGTDVAFTVKRVSESMGLFSITGSILVQKVSASAQKASAAARYRNDSTTETFSKKRKRSPSSTADNHNNGKKRSRRGSSINSSMHSSSSSSSSSSSTHSTISVSSSAVPRKWNRVRATSKSSGSFHQVSSKRAEQKRLKNKKQKKKKKKKKSKDKFAKNVVM